MPVSIEAPEPRIGPGGIREIGRVNHAIASAIGAATGGGPPNIFTTLARHRRLFRPWLRFASALMPGGSLPRADTELLILRVAHNTGCEYEWHHHERLARSSGLTEADVLRVRQGPEASGWSHHQGSLLLAADELHNTGVVSDALWSDLRENLSDAQLIELCMLVGHYEMLAMTLKSLRVLPDALPDRPPSRIARAIQARVGRRQRQRRRL